MEFIKAISSFFKSMDYEAVLPYLTGLAVLISGWKLYLEYRKYRLKIHLRPFYEDYEVADARKYYVETQTQNIPPSDEDEIRESITARKRIIKFFLKEGFQPRDRTKFYLVLGGAGTGKTTFMINLCRRYMERWWNKKYDICLFPIGDERTKSKIEKLKTDGKSATTILLLDALDEDEAAAEDFEARIDELLRQVADFKEVVITCRTQFIPREEAIPGRVRIRRRGPKGGFHQLLTFYISPFTDRDIRKYLNKKFGYLSVSWWGKKREAWKIVNKSPRLMARPMLLSYIDDLIDKPATRYMFIHQIYEAMIDRWLEREAGKRKGDPTKFIADLLLFSKTAAVKIYQNWKDHNQLYLSPSELNSLADAHNLDLNTIEMKSKSLLNRDAPGNLKFAHKSILEYFLALRAMEDYAYFYSLEFEGMDVLAQFCDEMIPFPRIDMTRIESGDFRMEHGPEVSLDKFEISRFPITQDQWNRLMGDNPSYFKGDDLPVENVSWEDCQEFIKKLNQMTGLGFRLPTEAEWEYAAGGGAENRTKWAGTNNGQQLDDYAWYRENSKDKTHPVGRKLPNALGLYDMSGNVWEWCQDWYGDYPSGPQNNPRGPDSGSARVLRGGSWGNDSGYCRVAYRYDSSPAARSSRLGFRLAR